MDVWGNRIKVPRLKISRAGSAHLSAKILPDLFWIFIGSSFSIGNVRLTERVAASCVKSTSRSNGNDLPMNSQITKVVFLFGGLVLVGLIGCTIDRSSGGAGVSGEIVRVSRQNNSGTYAYFQEAVVGKDAFFKQGSIDQSGSKDVVELVAKTPNAIGYSGMGYATEHVKMLAVSKDGEQPVPPTSENALSGTYPLARGLNIYIVGKATGAMKHYLDWIMSREGQTIVEEIGYVPAPGSGGRAT